MSMMTSQILKFVDSLKKQKLKCLENEAFFFFKQKNSFIVVY